MTEETNRSGNTKKDSLHDEHAQAGHDEKGGAMGKKKKKPDHKEDTSREWHQKYEELNDKYLRLYSEFDNYRKRTLKEKLEINKYASEEIILSFLPVIDDLERALKNVIKPEEGSEWVNAEGIQLIYNKFKGILTQKGLESIPSIGEDFSVDLHDALTNIPAPSEDLKGKVVDEIEKGYKLNGKVIRYSKVVVGI